MIKAARVYKDGSFLIVASLQGRISSHWELEAHVFSLDQAQEKIQNALNRSDLESPLEQLPTFKNPLYLREEYVTPVRSIVGQKQYRSFCRRAETILIVVNSKEIWTERTKGTRNIFQKSSFEDEGKAIASVVKMISY